MLTYFKAIHNNETSKQKHKVARYNNGSHKKSINTNNCILE